MARLGTWIRRKGQTLTSSCYRTYSLLFVPFSILALFGLAVSGRELIWNVDGLSQYYPFFVYEGTWIRQIIGGLFTGQGFQVPLWEWCSGYGADIPTTFDVFLDPLNLVSAITPVSLSEWVFQLLVVLRLYLAGLGFVFYCQTRGENRTGTVLGALLYALGGSGLTGVSWASGLHALMLFPVVLAGAERVLAGKRMWVFVASLTALAIVSYYFTYMAIILLVAYLALRVVMVERPHLTLGRFMRWVGVFAGLTVLCMVLAGFAIAPAATALMGMERLVDKSTVVPLLYAPSYYLQFVSGFLSIIEVGSDTAMGFGGLALLACLLLFSHRGEQRELKLVFVVLTVCMLIPVVGSFFNGLNYATNRWAWAYTMCVCLVLVRMTPALAEAGPRMRVLVVGTAIYALVLLFPACRTEANVAGYAAMLGALLLVVLAQNSELRQTLLVVALGLTVAVNGFYYLATEEDGKGKEQVPLGMALAKLTTNSADSVATHAGDDGWWRYDGGQVYSGAGAPIARVRNNSLVLALQGIDFYNSVYNDRVDAFHTELGVAGDYINFSFNDLQGRSDLMALLGVKYYLYRNDGTDSLPYGFAAQNTVASQTIMNVSYDLVRSDDALPLVVAYDKAISRDEYLKLTPAQRQQALLQAVVLEDARTSLTDSDGASSDKDAAGGNATGSQDAAIGATLVEASLLDYEDDVHPFTVAQSADVLVEDNRFVATAPGAQVTLAFEGVAQADTFLFVRGLSYKGLKPSELVSQEDMAKLPWHYRAQLLLQDISYSEPVFYQVSCKSDASSMTGYITNCLPSFHMYGGKDTWLVTLGYAQDAAHNVTLTFDQSGAYVYDKLEVVTQTHEKRAQWLKDRKQVTFKDMDITCNELTGTIELDEPATILFTMAYNEGWKAVVDGEKTDMLRADTGFMALDLGSGRHTIQLRYRTPGLALGMGVTGIGIVALVTLSAIIYRKHTTGGRRTPARRPRGKHIGKAYKRS